MNTDPQTIINLLTPPNIKYKKIVDSDLRTSSIESAERIFKKGEEHLEELLERGLLKKEGGYAFAEMEKAIQDLLKLGFRSDAYKFAMRYTSAKQEYSVH